MNRRGPKGAYCVFGHPVEGSRQGRVVLVEHHDILHAELGGSVTVKVWRSEKEAGGNGDWRHSEVRLEPDSLDPEHQAIVLRDVSEGDLRVVGQPVEVLG